MRNLHTVFQGDCTNLQSHQRWTRIPFSLHLHQCFLFVVFLVIPILTGVNCCLIVVLICNSLMISDVVHLFTSLLVICMSSLEKCVFRSSAHLLIGLFAFLMLSCMCSLNILDINPLSDTSFANIFYHSLGCLFV